jgi:hypothetical protein
MQATYLCVHNVVARQLLPDVLRIMRRTLLLIDARQQDFAICFICRSKEREIEVVLKIWRDDQA